MSDRCHNCDSAIVEPGVFKSGNQRYAPQTVQAVNHIKESSYADLCEKCGNSVVGEARSTLAHEFSKCRDHLRDRITDFPMMTVDHLPGSARYRIKGLVTANVTVGTGFLNEFSQGFSDLFGATNITTGMAAKINSGEATARSTLVHRAIRVGANAIIGVDVDYGTTANNAATINMQGTAVLIDDLEAVLDEPEVVRAKEFEANLARIAELSQWQITEASTNS